MTTVGHDAGIARRLVGVLEQATDGAFVADPDDTGADSIRKLGLNSVSMLAFLVAVEDEFGIEWDDDIAEPVLSSFDAMARHIADELGR